MGLHLAREHLPGHNWLMYDGAQHLGGGRPQIMTASSDEHTVTSSSRSYTSLVEEEYHLGQKVYPYWLVKPIGVKS